jgi:hypothetical protein
MTECLPDFPRYVIQREDGSWHGADDREGPWRPIPAPGLRRPWRTDGPAVLESREPASVASNPSDKELNTLWNCSGIADEHGNHTGNIFEFARAVLARWGHQPAPPAEGEVAAALSRIEFAVETYTGWDDSSIEDAVRDLRLLLQQQQAEIERLRAQQPMPVELPDEEVATIADRLVELTRAVTKERWSEFSMHVPARPLRDADLVISRAAKLLQQQQAEIKRLRTQQTPVLVSERLPKLKDCDEEGRCWWGAPVLSGSATGDIPHSWRLCRPEDSFGSELFWLPAHALPMPQGEVKP